MIFYNWIELGGVIFCLDENFLKYIIVSHTHAFFGRGWSAFSSHLFAKTKNDLQSANKAAELRAGALMFNMIGLVTYDVCIRLPARKLFRQTG